MVEPTCSVWRLRVALAFFCIASVQCFFAPYVGFRRGVSHDERFFSVSSRCRHPSLTIRSTAEPSVEDAVRSAVLSIPSEEGKRRAAEEVLNGFRLRRLTNLAETVGLSTGDIFDKRELVSRLAPMVISRVGKDNAAAPTDAVSAPMELHSLSSGSSIPSAPSSLGSDVSLRPSPGQFPALSIMLRSGQRLSMLVDTACTGTVLDPAAVRRCAIKTVNSPTTMMAAGGQDRGGVVAMLENFEVKTVGLGSGYMFPYGVPAAVQSIGALPKPMEGILGISFLKHFSHVDFNFRDKRFDLFPPKNANVGTPRPSPSNLALVCRSKLYLTSLGVYAVDVSLDNGFSPVRMLLDTGAACTLLNWKGVRDSGVSKNDTCISTNKNPVGLMGADNVAIALTHSLVVKGSFGIGEGNDRVNIKKMVQIDIGDVPILNMLEQDRMGGILGSDLLMMCGCVRVIMGSGSGEPIVEFYE